MLFVAIFVAVYLFSWIRNKYSLRHVETPEIKGKKGTFTSYTPEQIVSEIEKGKRLVIFDNLVLDLNGYENVHPGGRFNLRHNIGRDISKFFYGGYSLINKPKSAPHTHSYEALRILRDLVVGVLEG